MIFFNHHSRSYRTTPAILRRLTTTYTLSFYPSLRGELWRGIASFNRRPNGAILRLCLDNVPIAPASVAGAPASPPMTFTFRSISMTTVSRRPHGRIGASPDVENELAGWTVTDD